MTIFAILSQKANFNYLKVIIANKINRVHLKLAEREKVLIENNLLEPTWEHSSG